MSEEGEEGERERVRESERPRRGGRVRSDDDNRHVMISFDFSFMLEYECARLLAVLHLCASFRRVSGSLSVRSFVRKCRATSDSLSVT